MTNLIGFNHNHFLGINPTTYNKTVLFAPTDDVTDYDPVDNLYILHDITYKYNEYGFRCDKFDITSDHRILFLGCSMSKGLGVKLEESWAHVLLEKIKKDTGLTIPFWNISIAGAGFDALIRAYNFYYDKLKPNLVVAYFPSCARREMYLYDNLDNSTPSLLQPNNMESEKYELLLNENNIAYETQKNIKFLELMLQKYNTNLLWNGWGEGWQYVDQNFYTKYPYDITLDRKARNKMHPGPHAHSEFADILYKNYKDFIISTLS